MLRSLSRLSAVILMLASACVAQNAPKKSALDKSALETYVCHLYVMDKDVSVQISDPTPSAELPNFYDVTVSASMDNAHQDFALLVSKDGSKIIQGTVYDATENPFKKDLSMLNTAGAPSFGTAGAPVVLVEFSDFECPYCQKEAKILRDNLTASYPTQAHLYFKEFPLTSIHPWSKTAAIASRCVYKQNGDEFWKYHDWIFSHQDEINPGNLKDKVVAWAKDEKNLDTLQLGSCIENKATEFEVDLDMTEGRALKIDGTPTLFINGRRLSSAAEWPTLKAIIDYEIGYQKVAKNAGEDCGCSTKLNLPGAPAASPIAPVKSSKKK